MSPHDRPVETRTRSSQSQSWGVAVEEELRFPTPSRIFAVAADVVVAAGGDGSQVCWRG